MLIDGLHKAPLTSSGRSLPHPHALLLSLIVSSFRPCLGGAQSTAYRKLAFLPRFPVTNGPVSQGLALPQVLLLGPALLANTLCRGQEMCTMSKLEVRIGDFG